MNYFFARTSVILLVSFLVPFEIFAAITQPDSYANAVYATSVATYAPENAIGMPDGAYADFQDEFAYVTLDMGENEEGTGDLTFTSQILEYGAAWQVVFFDANFVSLQSATGNFDLYETETTVAYESAEPYRYVKVMCTTDKLWRLDAIEAASVLESIEEQPAANEEEPAASDEPAAGETPDPPQGLLVKLVDDGDVTTTIDAAVYVIGADGKRHAFPSELVYRSWFENYDDVAFIDPENLADYELGSNVTVRPGTWLIKIATDPKVYAVEPGGVLRWVTTEEIAQSLFGNEWNKRVIDVPDAYWGNYTLGDAITVEKHPEGTLAILSTGEVTYLDVEFSYSLPGDVLAFMRFSTDFSVTLSDEKFEVYELGGLLTENPDIAYPY
ncbi:hypothetical protein A2348_04170 [Candidatus Uhrbacteria bacterium RIFOXYB12_FULL_58_10]|uniref:Uncharacterized protein n=1 Tax=Candidatus Uhrbacteria bacterium RIFOXYB2_FULL_57_15 TaxID=1802422 RepID=A0A1F7W7U4_9BACT|nr:MAG: hypothetical protein A2348_04170 [Candidatus Uhrbacteria bacterium RIFOXYB12_FULL_58_10]OGL98849.1 MAG: hypothetical protein A2304_05155 [Candidatus Uhrbacteria bacterium RIFOXYB2_FULL_57_15]